MASPCHLALATALMCACGGPNSNPDTMTWATSSPIEQRCRQGDGDACRRAGLMYEEGKGFAIDVARAAALYRRGCAHEDPGACYRLARLQRRGMAVAADHTRAAELLTSACEQRIAGACVELAEMIDLGLLGTRDDDRIADLLAAACDAGDGPTCYALARRYEVGRGVAHDFRRAAQLHNSACERSHTGGCIALADLYARGISGRLDHHRAVELYDFACKRADARGCRRLGASLSAGRGRQPDAAAAATAYTRGCELGDGRACSELAAHYQRGHGVAVDGERAAALRQRARSRLEAACTVNDAEACTYLAVELRKRDDPAATARADELERRACQTGSVPACAALVAGNRASPDSRWTDTLDEACGNGSGAACVALAELADHQSQPDEALALLERGCRTGGHAPACAAQGIRLLEHNPDDAIAALGRACALGASSGCYQQGVALLERGRAVDTGNALTQLERACTSGQGSACYLLGEIYRIGTIVDRDRATARDRFERACVAEVGAACAAAGLMSEEDHGADKRSLALYQRACTGGSKLGCRRLGLYHAKRGPADRQQAESFLDRACRMGDAEACFAHSELIDLSKSADSARRSRAALERAHLAARASATDAGADLGMLRKLCRRDLAMACVDVGRHPGKSGDTGAGYLRRAAKLLDRECRHGKLATSCRDLAALYYAGHGGDRKAALRLMKQACKLDGQLCPPATR